ncbi:hypothetical protein [Pseudomonas rubra]|uniref:Uncharacterized protein n=1 Tax=Pseudomonas rubra TaxID=2942627 RepID=A0ABT5PDW0_9PSED|nr:hypothetical protein [Pseudomonas rubra]MDD1016337.1 hypothetical protein [Pseudomonas rubra]MDD1037086.1 hypothetical protein [Pseudomonas rubra]MDD1153747.1 hypothetical protein [Pseudomonas rubra]
MALAESFDLILDDPLKPRMLSRPRFPLGERIPVVVLDETGHEIPGDAGINLAQSESSTGVMVGVEPWLGQQLGQRVELYWGGQQVAGDPVTIVGQTLYLRVPADQLSTQDAHSISVFYRVYFSANDAEDSASARILLKLNRPGGKDRDASAPGHQGLPVAHVPQTIIDHGVDGEAAAAGVPVTIERYEHMRVRDLIELRWGGVLIKHAVSAEEAALGRVVVPVGERDILDAGDFARLQLTYRVSDEVRNESQDADLLPWSAPSAGFEVFAAKSSLPAPSVTVNGQPVQQIDLQALGDSDASVEVYTYRPDFAPGQWLHIHWRGLTHDDREITLSDEQQLERVPGAQRWLIANAHLHALAGGSARVSYELGASVGDPQARGSRRLSLPVVPAPSWAWPVPTVAALTDGVLEQIPEQLAVEVGLAAGAILGQRVVLVGSSASGRVLFCQSHDLSARDLRRGAVDYFVCGSIVRLQAEGQLALAVWVDGKHMRQVLIDCPQAQDAYSAPEVLQLEEGLLDPDKLTSQGATVLIPLDTRLKRGDRIMYYWQSSQPGGSAADTTEVSSTTRPVLFDVRKSIVQAGSAGTVRLVYQVVPLKGDAMVSEPLEFAIRPQDGSVDAEQELNS